VERYIYEFHEISSTWVLECRLAVYDQMLLFLQGLSEKLSTKVYQDLKLNVDEPKTFVLRNGFGSAVKLALTLNWSMASIDKLRSIGVLRQDPQAVVPKRQVETSNETRTAVLLPEPRRVLQNPRRPLPTTQNSGNSDCTTQLAWEERMGSLEKGMEDIRLFQQDMMSTGQSVQFPQRPLPQPYRRLNASHDTSAATHLIPVNPRGCC
jgi:hypothetical protein